MGKNLAGKTGFIIAVLVIFVYGIFGIPHGSLKQSITDRIHLGLDLRGGTHLVLKVNVAEALNSATDRDVQRLDSAIPGVTAAKLDPAHPEVITISGFQPAQQSSVHDTLTSNDYAAYDVTTASTGGYVLTMKQSAIADLEKRTLDQSIETIRQRVDSLGVSEPVIEQYGLGDNEILVQLPGVDDPGHVESIIQSTAKLEIHAVVGSYPDEQQAMTALNGVLPPDQELVKGSSGIGGPDQVYLLQRASIVEGTDFRDATPQTDENGRPDIGFTLTTEAGERFYKYTDANKGTGSMAIVLENRVKEVATIQQAIRDSGRITGGFTQQQAQDLSMMLRTGSLPASISYLETRSVGPSLGAASIHQGVVAAVAGMLAVMVFMLIYYRGAGINADLALFLNLVILLGFMGFTHAVLTLPGIAGVILTIGMGVDSNVLIFERIREELRLGKTTAAAVQEGFAHAWITIVDTHVTTIVSAGILFLFGTGPVKGFAVTLTFGLLANIFTAVFVSRVIFDYLLSKKERGAALSI
ncbi:protein translocase subunit SecD [Granulicella mallensis]|uniref:Protein translocase subunit SecD n=1 Tax=Granulicella mallensis (strain ATCC BAA-1857 / DSM 23137 / MP5ACTX8) TaxID=682795 RepID=G8NU43_GRAMM|nr:protein translocase subunit SecD [Granulicella mallensis]AEU38678.1 protein-export membrane protein SecD [Granulicella mallensis MP5ACTX8]